VMGGRGYAPVDVAISRAAPSAARALALDETLSAAHTSIGGMNILPDAGAMRRTRFAVPRFSIR